MTQEGPDVDNWVLSFVCGVDRCEVSFFGVWVSSVPSTVCCGGCPFPLVCSWPPFPKLPERIHVALILGALFWSCGPVPVFVMNLHRFGHCRFVT